MSAYTGLTAWYRRVSAESYETRRPVIWEVGKKGSGLTFVVEIGTVFDVSIPQGMRWLFDRHNPKHLKAACLHDEMLRRGWARTTAGAAFHEALRADGVSRWRRLAMWLAVSLWRYR